MPSENLPLPQANPSSGKEDALSPIGWENRVLIGQCCEMKLVISGQPAPRLKN